MSPSQHRIFVSHSHLDNAFGTRLTQDLRRVLKEESAVFYDVLGLHGGQDWWETIVEELTARDVFLLVLSPDAMNSIWVRREINIALNEGKYILPVLYRSCTIRADLKILQMVSFLAPKSYETAFAEILVALLLPTETPVEVSEPKEHVSQLPDPAQDLLNHLEAAFAARDWPDVIRKVNFLIQRMPASASATVYRMQGVAFLEEGEQQQAHEAFETALALVTDRQLRLTLLSDDTAVLAQQEQWSKVLQRAREALRLVPNDPGWLATRQQAQSQLVKPTPAQVRTKKRRLVPHPQNTRQQWLDEGNALNELKRYEEAITALDQAIRLDPNYALAYHSKGNALEKLEKEKEAQQSYERARQLGFNPAPAPAPQPQPKPAASASEATPLLPIHRDTFISAYDAVRQGLITDPETIRSIARRFDAIASNPEEMQKFDFDAARAAQNLYSKAQQIEGQRMTE